MNKRLETSRPAINAYHFYAFPLAILGNHPHSSNWVLNNFIQMCWDETPSSPVPYSFYLFDFASCPLLKTFRLDDSFLDDHEIDVVDFIREEISRNRYVYLFLNFRRVPNQPCTDSWDHDHDILITGIDDQKSILNALTWQGSGWNASSLASNSWSFGSLDIPIGDFYAGYRSHRERSSTPVISWMNLSDAEVPLDVELISRTLEEYRDQQNTSQHFTMLRPAWERRYGIGAHGWLRHSLKGLAINRSAFDPRGTLVYLEHKRLMTRRVRRLTLAKGDVALLDQARQLERYALGLHLEAIKQALYPGSSRLAEFLAVFDLQLEREERMTTEFIEHLESL